ncbi:MAG: hypothetical protein R3C14_34555 [Caldilineaceae bacterium]
MKHIQKTNLHTRLWSLAGFLPLVTILTAVYFMTPKSITASDYLTQEYNQPIITDLNSAVINPFLNVIPDPTGRELYVNIHGLSDGIGQLYVNSIIGPTGHQYSYTATYSNTQQLYAATVTGFAPKADSIATLNVTSTLGLATAPLEYTRAYIPLSMTRAIQLANGHLELNIVSTDTFAAETYLAFAPGFAPVQVVPPGHRVINQPYTINASGSITGTVRAMLLRLRYTPDDLNGAPPDALAIMQWQPVTQRWLRLPSTIYSERSEIVTTMRRFTTYALMVTPTWRDDFDDLAGLDIATLQNVDLKLKDHFPELLALTGNATSGVAVSKVITPPVAIQQWDAVTYSAVSNPPTTTLQIDLLDHNDLPLLTNLASGASLATIDPVAHPALRLRARFTSTVPGESALLDEWLLSWQPLTTTPVVTPTVTPEAYYIYLPEVTR